MPEPTHRPVCPKCHLPIRDDQTPVSYEGRMYHQHCLPKPGAAGDKDDPYQDNTPIGI